MALVHFCTVSLDHGALDSRPSDPPLRPALALPNSWAVKNSVLAGQGDLVSWGKGN